MSATTYAAWWPVHDDTRTLRQLAAEATPDLTRMAADAGHAIVGEIRWDTSELDDGLVLLATAPVEPFEDDEPEPQPQTRAEQIADEIEHLMASDPGFLPQNAADRFGIPWESVRQALVRGDRRDLAQRITRNHEVRNAHLFSSRKASA